MQEADKQSALAEAAEWYLRHDAGPLSAEEMATFEDWLSIAENRQAYARLDSTWQKLSYLPRPEAAAPFRARAERGAGRRQAFAAIAAVGLLLAVGYLLDLPLRLQADAMAPVGGRVSLKLADGSMALLNTGSAIAVDYSSRERRVHLLRGEAVFEVAKNPERPFIVEADRVEARALGTAFGVRESEGAVTVTVLESRVAVSYPPLQAASVELSPDEAVSYAAGRAGPVEAVNADNETAWRRGKLVFVDRPLGSVISELNRYHAGRIQITDETISGHLVSGVFDISDPVGTLDTLEASLGLHSTRLTNYLILLHR